MPKFYLTTPLYYANARPHVGSAYSTIVCDTIARYKRMRGYDVAFLTGTDEHGENIARAAAKAGVSPQEHVNRLARIFQALWRELGIEYTHFIRTSSAEHERAVHRILLRARDAGYIYKGKYQGRYCIHDNLYVSDSTEPANCPTCGRPAELVSEENYFFKLSAFEKRLLELYEKNPEFVQPDFRRNEAMSFVQSGLRDISVSRKTVKWGIPWPEDPEQVVYVWYDALTGYMTGVGYGDDELQWEKYWPADLHLIGKEIIRFHCVYWPAFLMAAEEPLPKQVFAHGWLLFQEQKMSKSKGNIAYAEPILRTLGADALRYYLLRDVSFGQDSNFSHDALVTRYNADLANGLGNFASRVLAMVQNYFEGLIPEPREMTDEEATREALPPDVELVGSPIPGYPPDPRVRDENIQTNATTLIREVSDLYDRYLFSRALERIWDLISDVEKYLVIQAPWKMAADDTRRDRLGHILYTAAEALRIVAALAHPAIPVASERIWRQLGQFEPLGKYSLDGLRWGQLRPGTRVGAPKAVFPRVKKDEALDQIDVLEQELLQPTATAVDVARQGAAKKEAKKNVISIEDFAKVDMRVGEVKSAERVAGTDKLLKILVDIGDEVRQVVAGIAEVYKPETLPGRKVVVVTNLQPRKLRGVESNGMIVAASVEPGGRPVLVTFTEEVPVGSRLK